jgi:hypothetical protein
MRCARPHAGNCSNDAQMRWMMRHTWKSSSIQHYFPSSMTLLLRSAPACKMLFVCRFEETARAGIYCQCTAAAGAYARDSGCLCVGSWRGTELCQLTTARRKPL